MATENTAVAGLTLPPKVVGRVSGHLVMKVDEVLWSRKPPGEVTAVVMWWGGEEATIFRPSDVAENVSKRKNSGVIYEIRTSLLLFEKYLRKCGSLDIAMADKYGMPIGCASVKNLYHIVSGSPYQGYYPIVNNFGNRIGDLHVCFNLRMLSNAENVPISLSKSSKKQGVKTKELKRLSPVKSQVRSKEEKTKKNEKVLQDSLSSPESAIDVIEEGEVPENHQDILCEESLHKRVSPTSNIISQILEHGTRLRDAMAASVMEDSDHLIPNHASNLNSSLYSLNASSNRGLKTESDSHVPTHGGYSSCARKADLTVERKVMEYLSGKPLSEKEEKEALAALRSMTPTKDILDNAPSESPWLEECPKLKQDPTETDSKKADFSDDKVSTAGAKYAFGVDSELLSQINCVRITVCSLVLNSLGIKRTGSSIKKKRSYSHSGVALHPPGTTYFVEYKFPVVGNRPWESNIRYCSKRLSSHEVTFGDRTVHNLPAAWRRSISDESNLGSVLSSLCFKVCARHLHQRIPIPVGLAVMDSVKSLFESANLRQDFDLSVIAADRLPVAQLKLCVELGRDRIHFGGLLDPENNSLGIESPKTQPPSSKGVCATLSVLPKKRSGGKVTSVTRNISSMSSVASNTKNKMQIQQASQADRLIKQLVDKVSQKASGVSETSSAPSTARPHLKPLNCEWDSRMASNFKSNPQHSKISSNNELFKHQLALTILEIRNITFPLSVSGGDQGFFVKYKFPILGTVKNKTVDWQSISTQLSVCADGKWKAPQNKVFSFVLDSSESFHSLIQRAFRYQGQESVTFSLHVRCFGDEVQDFLVAEATLPHSCIVSLENAYKEAARSNPNFSQSSCSSITLELPLEYLPLYKSQVPFQQGTCLLVKFDYRNSSIKQDNLLLNSPHSCGDSVTKDMMGHDIIKTSDSEGEPAGKPYLEAEGQRAGFGSEVLPTTVPNWARCPAKNSPHSVGCQERFHLNQEDNLHLNQRPSCDEGFLQFESNAHQAYCDSTAQQSDCQTFCQTRGAHLTSNCPYGHEECNVRNKFGNDIFISEVPNQVTRHLNQLITPISQDLPVDSNFSFGSKLSCVSRQNEERKIHPKTVDAATSPSFSVCQRFTSMTGTSPKSVENIARSQERIHSSEDKSLQAVVTSVNQGCQTTPRESKKPLQKDVEISVNIDDATSKQEAEISAPLHEPGNVHPRQSIDDVELIEVVSEDISQNLTHSDFFIHSTQGTSSQEALLDQKQSEISSGSLTVDVGTFSAKVGVDYALHLRSCAAPEEKTQSVVFVTLNPCEVDGHISSIMGLSSVSVSPAVVNNSEPEWNWQTCVQLPLELLISSKKRLIFKIWESEKSSSNCSVEDPELASLIGFSALDLTVLSAGLPLISGWYNIMDFSGTCRGQIKLSVEPLENIPRAIDFSDAFIKNHPHGLFTLPMFIAHGEYKDFPSHVAQFPELQVKKVQAITTDQTTSSVLGINHNLMQNFQNMKSKLPPSTNEDVALEEKEKSTCNSSKGKCGLVVSPPTPILLPKLTNEGQENPSSAIEVDKDKDPSLLLREKLSELDAVTNTMKAKLSKRMGSPHCTGTFESEIEPAQKHLGEGDNIPKCAEMCGTCACSYENSRCAHSGCPSESASRNREMRSVHKQRKTWEKQEDLIDFGALHIDDRDGCQQSPPCEDLSEWLSESALQQVFNPFLFNDILNNMNSSRGGVQVIELDDTETSDDNQNSPAVGSFEPHHIAVSDDGDALQKNTKRRSRRGDETYRKETPVMAGNDAFLTGHNSRTGVSGCDADSGVDVDVSANFHSRAFFGVPRTRTERYLPHSRTNIRAVSSEREESSCSQSSPRYHQSTLPSSTSATPSDSPQHSHQKRHLDEL